MNVTVNVAVNVCTARCYVRRRWTLCSPWFVIVCGVVKCANHKHIFIRVFSKWRYYFLRFINFYLQLSTFCLKKLKFVFENWILLLNTCS
jgi:hypothetical protein